MVFTARDGWWWNWSSSVIAKESSRICSVPFFFEGKVRQEQALIEESNKQVLFNRNQQQQIKEVRKSWFQKRILKADEVLAISRGIAEGNTSLYSYRVYVMPKRF
jgi:hypothetical protein